MRTQTTSGGFKVLIPQLTLIVGSSIPPPLFASKDSKLPEVEKRYKSFDDAVAGVESGDDIPRPGNPRSSLSFPLLHTLGEIDSAQPILTLEEFEEEMARAITSADERRKGPKEPFSDADVNHISSLLAAVGRARWSERPRIYLVLRLVDEVKAIECFIMDGHKDVPVSVYF